MDIISVPLLLLFKSIIKLLVTVILMDVLVSWLMLANVLNSQNRFVYIFVDSLSKISDFMLSPIRRKMPKNIGALDISPVIFILILSFLEWTIDRILIRFM